MTDSSLDVTEGRAIFERSKQTGPFMESNRSHLTQWLHRNAAALLDAAEELAAWQQRFPDGEPNDWQYGYHAGIVATNEEAAKVIREYEAGRDAALARESKLREAIELRIVNFQRISDAAINPDNRDYFAAFADDLRALLKEDSDG